LRKHITWDLGISTFRVEHGRTSPMPPFGSWMHHYAKKPKVAMTKVMMLSICP